MGAFFLKQTVQHIPIRAAQPYQLPQGGALVCGKQDRMLLTVETESIIQKTSSTSFTLGGSSYTNFPRSCALAPMTQRENSC